MNPIIVTGCPRSGTSLVAGIIHKCGAFGGEMFGPTQNNKKGFFENRFVREQLVKGYLKKIGADPLGQKDLPKIGDLIPQPNWAKNFEQEFRQEGYRGGPLFVKSVKGCLFWPIWNEAFPDAKWVIVRRDDREIAESCLRTSFMRAYTDIDGWLGWVEHHKQCFDQIWQHCSNVREIWPATILSGDLKEIQAVIDWCGLEWNEEEVKDFIDPSLWNGTV